MKIGNIYFNPDSFIGVSLEEFKRMYRGKLDGVDIEVAYKKIQKENKVEPKKKSPKIKK